MNTIDSTEQTKVDENLRIMKKNMILFASLLSWIIFVIVIYKAIIIPSIMAFQMNIVLKYIFLGLFLFASIPYWPPSWKFEFIRGLSSTGFTKGFIKWLLAGLMLSFIPFTFYVAWVFLPSKFMQLHVYNFINSISNSLIKVIVAFFITAIAITAIMFILYLIAFLITYLVNKFFNLELNIKRLNFFKRSK